MNEHERFLAIKKIMIESDVKNAVMKPLSPATLDVIEKFIKHHNLKIKLDEVIGYYDFALFGGGKKGVLLSADFLYESQNGKPQEPYWFKGLASVSLQKYDLTMVYEDGKKITFFASIFADYYADLMNKIIQLNAKNTQASQNAQKEAEEQERKRIQDEVKAEIAARLKQKKEEELRLKQKKEEELRLKQKAEELRLKQKSEEELRLKQKALEKKKADLEKKRQELEEKRTVLSLSESDAVLYEKAKARRKRIENEKNSQPKTSHTGADGLALEKKVENQKCSYESKKIIEESIMLYSGKMKKMTRGVYLKNDDFVKIKSYNSRIDPNEVIGFYDASMGFSKKWMIFTVNSYYDSNGNGIRYSDIGKVDTVVDKPCVSVRNKKGQLLGTYHVPADKYEVYSLLNRAGNFDSKMIWERGKELEKSGKNEQAFLLYLEAAIHWNNHIAMNDVGVCYGLGKYVKKDAERALYWYEKAAKLGNTYAPCNAGVIAKELKLYNKAHFWFSKTIDEHLYNEQNALNELGLFELNGYGREVNVAKAIQYFEKGNELGNHYCAYNLARIYTYCSMDYSKAIKYIEKAMAKGHSGAKFLLGRAYMYGCGVPADYDKAYQLISESGAFDTPVALGDYYLEIKKDVTKAISYYKQAAAKNNPLGYAALGKLYRDGYYTEVDLDEALYWFEKGADKEFPGCISLLGEMMKDGIGIVRDEAKALELFKKGSELNHVISKAALAKMIAEGKTEKKDLAQAAKLISASLYAENRVCKMVYADMVMEELISELPNKRLSKTLIESLAYKGMDYEQQLHDKMLEVVDYYLKKKDSQKQEDAHEMLYHMSLAGITDAKLRLMKGVIAGEFSAVESKLPMDVRFVKELYLEDKITTEEAVAFAKMAHVHLVKVTGITDENRINAKRYLRLARRFKREGQHEEAVKLLKSAVLLNPDLWQASALLADYFTKAYVKKDDRTAFYLYRLAVLSPEYRYDPETEFKYASIRLDGKGCIQDLSAGNDMLLAVKRGYTKGLDDLLLSAEFVNNAPLYEFFIEAINLKESQFNTLYQSDRGKKAKEFSQKAMGKFTRSDNNYKALVREIDKYESQSYLYKPGTEYEVRGAKESIGHGFVTAALMGSCAHAKDRVRYLHGLTGYGITSEDFGKVYPRYTEMTEDSGKLYFASWSSTEDALMRIREFVLHRDENDENHKKAMNAIESKLRFGSTYVNIDAYYRDVLLSHFKKHGNELAVKTLQLQENQRTRQIQVEVKVNHMDQFLETDLRRKYAEIFRDIEEKHKVRLILESYAEVYYLSKPNQLKHMNYSDNYDCVLTVKGKDVENALCKCLRVLISNEIIQCRVKLEKPLEIVSGYKLDVKGITGYHTLYAINEETGESIKLISDVKPSIYHQEAPVGIIKCNQEIVAAYCECYEDYQMDDFLYHFEKMNDENNTDDSTEIQDYLVDECWSLYDAGKLEEAFKEVKPLAEQGNAKAQNMLGYLYAHDTENGFKQAFDWYDKAIKADYVPAYINMGNLLNEQVEAEEMKNVAHSFYFGAFEFTKKKTARCAYQLCKDGLVNDPEYEIAWKMRLTELHEMDATDEIIESYKAGIQNEEVREIIDDFIKELAKNGYPKAISAILETRNRIQQS